MSSLPFCQGLLLLPHIRVQNANTFSSFITWGFPSMTAFLGLMWNLERKYKKLQNDYNLIFKSVGVVCHNFQPQIADIDFYSVFCQSRNPLTKEGKTSPINEEGRTHLDISLIFGVTGSILFLSEEEKNELAQNIMALVSEMRIAGGSVFSIKSPFGLQPSFFSFDDFEKIRYKLLPGFSLVERPDLLAERHEMLKTHDSDASLWDAWLSLSRFNWRAEKEKNEADGTEKIKWQHDRKGWIVPIPVGYAALTSLQEPGSVENARDTNVPFAFVEPVFGIGEWIAPHKLKTVEQLLWFVENTENLFRCKNTYINF